MRELQWVVSSEDEGRAVRTVVPRRFSLGSHAFRRLKVQGGILVNGVPARADRLLHAGDVLTVRLLTEGPVSVPGVLPEGEGCAVRYLDGDLIIVSKGAPLPTLPSCHQRGDTLRERLAVLLGEDPEVFRYHPVNRLDKGTSGLLAVARHDHAQRLLAKQLHSSAFRREYLAVTEGVPRNPEGVIDAPIARLGEGARRCIRADGQPARTHYRVESVSRGRALIRLWLETGRTHQIRVHLASLGCPIVGDYLYGREEPSLPGRFALHSARLACTQPITGEQIDLTEPLPSALAALLTPPPASCP